VRFPSGVHVLGVGFFLVTSVSGVAAQTPSARTGQTSSQASSGTGKDTFPNGCVDCHTSTAKGGDARLSVLLSKWNTAVEPSLLAKSRAAAADPAKIKGKHPTLPSSGANLPQGCLTTCHKKSSVIAPPFTVLMHSIHLTGTPNQFLSAYQGECTHCHKLDVKTGAWTMPSGAEK